jgi:hypothetical protein
MDTNPVAAIRRHLEQIHILLGEVEKAVDTVEAVRAKLRELDGPTSEQSAPAKEVAPIAPAPGAHSGNGHTPRNVTTAMVIECLPDVPIAFSQPAIVKALERRHPELSAEQKMSVSSILGKLHGRGVIRRQRAGRPGRPAVFRKLEVTNVNEAAESRAS